MRVLLIMLYASILAVGVGGCWVLALVDPHSPLGLLGYVLFFCAVLLIDVLRRKVSLRVPFRERNG
jgi:hypothetical protein